MKAEEFVHELQRAQPSEEELASYGLDEDEIEEVISGFRAVPRENPNPITVEAGEIGRLVALYECSSVQVGIIQFDSSIAPTKAGYRFASCEADPLYVSHDGAVVMHDHSASDSTPTRCASDTERFLDALAEFLHIQSQKEAWKHRAEVAVERCTAASGELTSAPLYRLLLAYLQ